MNREPRMIDLEMEIPAPIGDVWKAWTTQDGIRSFFARECNIDIKPDGLYEIFFFPEAEPGHRGADGMRVLAVQQEQMLSFTWNAPAFLPEVRRQRTHVTIYFYPTDDDHTRLRFVHDGWGSEGEWDQAFQYFQQAWGKVVLPRLRYRFKHGPIDWNHPPQLEE